MRVGFIITARMKSTRLPQKLLLKLNGREVIKWMIDRAKLVFQSENIVIATSKNPQDDILETVAQETGIQIFRGHEEDVVERLYLAARQNGFDYMINITGDCPLFGFDYVEKLEKIIKEQEPDILTSLELPHGIFVYAIKTQAFEKVLELKKTDHTEVWGDFFYSNPDKFKICSLPVNEDEKRPDFRLTIDYPEDFQLFEKIFDFFGTDTYKTSTTDIINFLDRNPDIASINYHCKSKYQTRWESQIATKNEG